jgi:hypothetical protein
MDIQRNGMDNFSRYSQAENFKMHYKTKTILIFLSEKIKKQGRKADDY